MQNQSTINPKSAAVDRLLACLRDQRSGFYSFRPSYLCQQLGVTADGLWALADAARRQEQINVFTWNGITYIGTEQRRLDYERDTARGTNRVEARENLSLGSNAADIAACFTCGNSLGVPLENLSLDENPRNIHKFIKKIFV